MENFDENIDKLEKLLEKTEEILKKYTITEEDVFTLYDLLCFIEKENKLIGLCVIMEPELREEIFDALEGIHKIEGFEEAAENMVYVIHLGIEDNINEELDSILQEISIDELDSALEFYYEIMLDFFMEDIDILSIVKSKMKIEDFAKSKTLAAFSNKLKEYWNTNYSNKNKQNNNNKSMSKKISVFIEKARESFQKGYDNPYFLSNAQKLRIIEIGKEYIDSLNSKGITVDFRNDQFLNSFPEDAQKELKQHHFLINGNDNNLTIKDISIVNDAIIKLLEETREKGENLKKEDKIMLENYFKHFYSKASREFYNMTKVDKRKFYRVLELTERAIRYFFGKSEDETFFKSIVPERDAEYVAILFQNELDDEGFRAIAINDTYLIFLPDFKTFISNMKAKDSSFDFTKLESTKVYLENFIERALKESKTEANKSNSFSDDYLNIRDVSLDFIFEYVNFLINKPDFNLFDEQYLSDILQLIRTNKIDSDLAYDINQSINDKFDLDSKDSKEELSKIHSIIDSNPSKINEADFDEMIKHLQVLKLKDYRINDRKILNYILLQALDSDSCISNNPDKYKGLIERILEDFALADLPFELQKNYCCFFRDELNNSKVLGTHNSPKQQIKYKMNLVDSFLKEKNVEVLNVIFHENTHAVQGEDLKTSKVDSFYKYLMIKEKILLTVENDYYVNNYENVFIEIEARQKAREKLSSYINRLPKDIKTKVINVIVSKELESLIKEKEELSKGLIKTNVFKENKPKENVSTIFDEIIKQNPIYIKKYPLLQMEYNQDGSLKSLQDIFVSMENDNVHSHRALYFSIIKRGNSFKLDNLENDMNFILNYDIKKRTSSSVAALVFGFMFTRLLENIDEMPDEDRKKAYAIIDNVNKKLKEINEKGENTTRAEKAFRTALTKTNGRMDKSLIELLNEEREETSKDNLGSKEAKIMADAFYSTSEGKRIEGKKALVDSQTQIKSDQTNDDKPKVGEKPNDNKTIDD